MASLWGSKKNSHHDDEGDRHHSDPAGQSSDHHQSSDHRQDEATERTRLLPRHDRSSRSHSQQPAQDGYLDPDDPAVSPYNLWSVRALRYFAVFFFFVSFLWWVLLFVSIFVSPPGMHTRGSGFFDFSYTTVALGNLATGILFFAIPSKSLEISNLVVALLLLIDMIIIVAVPRLRHEEGWVGIASVVWATLMALYVVLSDRVVAWGKSEEEVRLTGRRETRRSLREWCAILTYTAIMVVLIIVTLLMTGTLILRARDSTLDAPGKLWYVDGNKYQVHIHCIGNATDPYTRQPNPTILLEAGKQPSEASLEPFIQDTLRTGTIQRYCLWDRPGVAWSDNAPSPHSAGMSADALSEALAQAGEDGPWILVSADIGSIYSRVFSSRHLGEVAGILLIDPLGEEYLWEVGDAGRGFLLWAYGVISPLGLIRIPGALFRGRTREDRVFGRAADQNGKSIKAQLQENLVATSLTRTEIGQARNIQKNTQGRDVPLVVVSSGVHARQDSRWDDAQRDLTNLTDKLIAWETVRHAPAEVWTTDEGAATISKHLGRLVEMSKDTWPLSK